MIVNFFDCISCEPLSASLGALNMDGQKDRVDQKGSQIIPYLSLLDEDRSH